MYTIDKVVSWNICRLFIHRVVRTKMVVIIFSSSYYRERSRGILLRIYLEQDSRRSDNSMLLSVIFVASMHLCI